MLKIKQTNINIILSLVHLSIFLDNVGYIFKFQLNYNLYLFFRIFGRLFIPIICYCVVKEFLNTDDKISYIYRLYVYGFILLITNTCFLYLGVQSFYNINFFMLLGTGCLMIYFIEFYYNISKYITIFFLLSVMLLLEFIHVDYASYGILLMLIFYRYSNDHFMTISLFILLNFINLICEKCFYLGDQNIQMYSILSLPIILLLNNDYKKYKFSINSIFSFILFLTTFLFLIRLMIIGY